jgi:hypothetical protein
MPDVTLSGPLFDGRAEAAMEKAIQAIQEKLSEAGGKMAAQALSGSIRVEHTGRAVSGITSIDASTVFQTGKYTMPVIVDPGTMVVTSDLATYGPWLEGTGSRNETTRFRGYFSFRAATQELDEQAGDIADEALQPYLAEMQLWPPAGNARNAGSCSGRTLMNTAAHRRTLPCPQSPRSRLRAAAGAVRGPELSP